MKIVLNTYKICDAEPEKFIIVKLDQAEVIYNLYQKKIIDIKDNMENLSFILKYTQEREINNLYDACLQILTYLNNNNIPYTYVTDNKTSFIKIYEINTRTRNN